MKAKNALKSMLVLPVFGLSFAWSSPIQADDPPATPSLSVLMYYDGSPSLCAVRDIMFTAFAAEPEYLPIVQTTDAPEFDEQIAARNYDVYLAITSDTVLPRLWADSVQGGFSEYVAFFPATILNAYRA